MLKVKQDSVPLWEKIFAVAGLFLSTYAVISLVRKQNGLVFDPFEGDIIIQALWVGIYSITLFLILKHWRQVIKVAFQDKFLWLLLGLAFASILWSGAPMVTLRRCAALFGTMSFGVYLAARYTGEELLKLLLWALGACAVLSIVFVLLLPSYGIHYKTYLALRGVYENKNNLGCFMALSAIAWLLYCLNQSGGRMVGAAFCAVSIALLLLSNSITAFLVFFILLFLLLIYYLVHYRNIRGVIPITFLTAGCSFLWLFKHLGSVLALLGRDVTLTGRTLIWQKVWSMVMLQPWLGYGYSAFWLGWNGPSSYIWHALPSKVISAHSGFLDLWLQLGLAGVIIFFMSFFTAIYKAHVLLRDKNSISEMFPLLFLLFILIYNISESAILVQNSLFWILYTAVSLQLRKRG